MNANHAVVIQSDSDWWIGWIEEVQGVNGQGRTCEECLASLRSALKEALEMDRAQN